METTAITGGIVLFTFLVVCIIGYRRAFLKNEQLLLESEERCNKLKQDLTRATHRCQKLTTEINIMLKTPTSTYHDRG